MDVHQVPAVDIAALIAFPTDAEANIALRDAKDEAVRNIIEEIRAAATEWGFFYIVNHGLPEREVGRFQGLNIKRVFCGPGQAPGRAWNVIYILVVWTRVSPTPPDP
ncbi:hypothetical protein DVH05_006865 [Phytophthora capsici]|nr:hypothetical protein DVH05_006865 [Phytophthora capsici]